ncbi:MULTISPECIES: S8 family serine peptidase [unclassified Micromonospora]|uniref:S8 family serine peptidase n=1 Tax=unclassified Micromonospora TaxID=2617518 RepID=UPI0036414DE5
MSTRRHGRRRWLAAATAVLTALLALPAQAGAAPPAAQSADPSRKLDGSLLRQLAAGAEVPFMVQLAGEAELDESALDRAQRKAGGRAGRTARTRLVYEAKVAHAERSQRDVRSLLHRRGAAHTPYWIANVIAVTGGLDLATELAGRADVAAVTPVAQAVLEDPISPAGAADAAALPWNLTQVGAGRVWDEFGVTGQGVVVGSIDSGVDFDHPALVRQYRGSNGDGTFDHDHNWYDPTGICGAAKQPCDNYGHGTHTTGTVLGDDGTGRPIGVAPGATWIAAKGCEADRCSETALLAAGQWMVAPTDRDGNDPRPELSPDIVNNSWGGLDDGYHFYEEILSTWLAAGIFPVFSVGNEGEGGCNTAGYPSTSPLAYAVGAVDRDGAAGYFSSRGAARDGATRPDIAAPGVDVVSSLPGGGYGSASGTSMAAPHVAGAIALLWSAVPNLRRDVATTRELLDRTAHDRDDDQCGGTTADNNVYGEGTLDAYALVSTAPAGALGGVAVTATRSGWGLPGATVSLTSATISRGGRTDSSGEIQLGRVPAGDYALTVSAFGQRTQRRTVTVPADGTAAVSVDVSESAPWHPVSGTVTDPSGKPVPGAKVALLGTDFPAFVAGADGAFAGAWPEADYQVRVTRGTWLADRTVPVTVDGPEVVDVALAAKTDRHGYAAGVAPAKWLTGGGTLALRGDEAHRAVPLPFPMTFYGRTYAAVTVHSNGYVAFGDTGDGDNTALPSPKVPAPAVYAHWDDLVLDKKSRVVTRTTGSAPNRRFTVSWVDAAVKAAPGARVSFQLALGEDGRVTVVHHKLDAQRGGSATVGIAAGPGGSALTYSLDEAVLDPRVAVTFRVPGRGLVRGTVRDANDRKPVAGASVRLVPDDGPPVAASTDAAGFYSAEVTAGAATVTPEKGRYVATEQRVTVPETAVLRHDAKLRTPLLTARGGVSVKARAGTTATATVTLENRGSATGTWDSREIDSATAPTGVPGQVLTSFPLTDLYNAYGVGNRDGELVVTDSYFWGQVQRFTTDGADRGKGVVGMNGYPSDLTYVASRDLMCGPSLSISGELPIVCFDPDTLEVTERITGPWTGKYYYGLAYRAADDTFFLAGDGRIQRLAGLSQAQPGAVLGECVPSVPWISGLAYNEKKNVLWGINGDDTEAIWAMDPDSCAILGSIPDPDPNPISGAGLDIDDNGDLWLVAQAPWRPFQAKVYHVDGGLPAYRDVPWLSATKGGTIEAGRKGTLTLTVDTTGLAPGTYVATVLVVSDSVTKPGTPVKVTLTVTPAA